MENKDFLFQFTLLLQKSVRTLLHVVLYTAVDVSGTSQRPRGEVLAAVVAHQHSYYIQRIAPEFSRGGPTAIRPTLSPNSHQAKHQLCLLTTTTRSLVSPTS